MPDPVSSSNQSAINACYASGSFEGAHSTQEEGGASGY